MINPLTRKLSSFTTFSADDLAHLNSMCQKVLDFRAGQDLIQEGDRPDHVFLLVRGWACRYKLTADGRRQILAYLIPGDLCDVHIFILKEMDHAIGVLNDARVVAIPKDVMRDVMRTHPNIAEALWWATLVDEAVLREWLVNVGQRKAVARLAHLLCELWLRLKQVDMLGNGEFCVPLTQSQLADTTGLTTVHVNHTLQQLRKQGLVSMQERKIIVHDIAGLREIADFNPNYLHLDPRT